MNYKYVQIWTYMWEKELQFLAHNLSKKVAL